MAWDRDENQLWDRSDPARGAAVIVPDNSNDLPYTTRGIYFPTAGTIVCVMKEGMTVTISSVSGLILPIAVNRVLTGGTVTDAIALW